MQIAIDYPADGFDNGNNNIQNGRLIDVNVKRY